MEEKFSRSSAADEHLACRISHFDRQLNFTLHSGTGYVLQFPVTEFRGQSNRVKIFVRATPGSAPASPLYFVLEHKVPPFPPEREKEAATLMSGVEQWLPLEPASYRIDVVAIDDQNRVCREAWNSNIPQPPTPLRIQPFRHLTLMISGGASHLPFGSVPSDTSRSLPDSVSALLDWLPADTVRVVNFSLAARQELFRSDAFNPGALDKLANTLEAENPAPTDDRLLRNTAAPASFLADLFARELSLSGPNDVVVLLGRPENSGSVSALDVLRAQGNSKRRFFYLQLVGQRLVPFPSQRPYTCESAGFKEVPTPAGMMEDPHGCHVPNAPSSPQTDAVEYAIQTLHGKTFTIHNPGELALAVREIARIR